MVYNLYANEGKCLKTNQVKMNNWFNLLGIIDLFGWRDKARII